MATHTCGTIHWLRHADCAAAGDPFLPVLPRMPMKRNIVLPALGRISPVATPDDTSSRDGIHSHAFLS